MSQGKIEFLCPFCEVRLGIVERKAGSEVKCPQCAKPVIVPTPSVKPQLGIIIEPYSESAPPSVRLELPPSSDPEPEVPAKKQPERELPFEHVEDEGEEEQFDFSFLRKQRRVRRWLARGWRITTLAAIATSLVCFFLPWMRYTVILPQNEIFKKGHFEFASQSGFEATFGLASYHPAIGAWEKYHSAAEEARWKKEGKSPIKERWKQNLPYTAVWLLIHPFALVLAGLMVLMASPNRSVLVAVSLLLGLALLPVLIQFGILGSPAVAAFYDELGREGDGAGLLALSILLEVHYTTSFSVTLIAIAFGILAQVAVRMLSKV